MKKTKRLRLLLSIVTTIGRMEKKIDRIISGQELSAANQALDKQTANETKEE